MTVTHVAAMLDEIQTFVQIMYFSTTLTCAVVKLWPFSLRPRKFGSCRLICHETMASFIDVLGGLSKFQGLFFYVTLCVHTHMNAAVCFCFLSVLGYMTSGKT